MLPWQRRRSYDRIEILDEISMCAVRHLKSLISQSKSRRSLGSGPKAKVKLARLFLQYIFEKLFLGSAKAQKPKRDCDPFGYRKLLIPRLSEL